MLTESEAEQDFIDLVREPPFQLVGMQVSPPSRELISGGTVVMLQPRIMQVLIALARRRGEVVSRNELILACWRGRAVGEDAINRCIQAIRRIAEAQGGFAVQTIAGVGYRLIETATTPDGGRVATLDSPPDRVHAQAPVSAQPVGARAERRHLTVLSCHLVRAPDGGAEEDPEDRHATVLRRRLAVEAIMAPFGGYLAAGIGDSLMVYFGYPEAREDAAECAIRAGLAAIEGLTSPGSDSSDVGLAVRIGIHAGLVVIDQDDRDLDLFGEALEIALQVQAVAEPGAVLVTEAVLELVAGLFVIEARSIQSLRGAANSTPVFRVISPVAAALRGPRFSARELTPHAGRKDEMQLLSSCWTRVNRGEGQLVLLTGEPGIGKTRLVWEFRNRIDEAPHRWIACGGDRINSNTPFHAVAGMLDQIFRRHGDGSPLERIEALELALSVSGLERAEYMPLIGELLSLPVTDKYPPLALTADEKRRRLLACLAAWIFNLVQNKPLVLVIEDMQWLDPSSLELLLMLIEQGASGPLMLLCTARPEFRPTWPTRSHHTHIALDRLSPAETRALVMGVFAQTELGPDVIDALIARTDGVPLFAEELTRWVLESEGEVGQRDIPATLYDSLAARLARTGRAKDTAQLAAVLGREFTYPLIAALSPLPADQLQADLAKLADAELIYVRGVAPESKYKFKHALIQDAAYEEILKGQRQALHARVAQTITERFAALAEAQPEVIALHWTRAGQAEPAVAAWKMAGDTAYGRRAFKEAEAAYRQGLATLATLPDSPARDAHELDLCSALNRVLQLTVGYAAPAAVEVAARARSLAEKSGNLSELIREEARMWRAVITTGDYASAAALADHILELAHAEGDNPGRLVFVHNAQVQTRFYTGDLAGVETHFALLSPLIDTVGKRQAPGNNIVAIGIASLTAWAFGHSELAHARMDRALAFAEESQNPYDLAMALHFQGNLLACERDADRAEAIATQLRTLSEANSFSYLASLALVPLGWARAQKGAAAEGVELIARTLTDQVASGARVSIAATLNRLAEARALNGAAPKALATIEEALTANPQELVYRPESFRIRGTLRAKQGESALAEADFREAIRLSQVMGAIAFELRAAVSLTGLLRRRGEASAAQALVAPLYARFTDGLEARDLTEAKALLDELSA